MKTQKLIKLLYASTLILLLFSCKKYYKEDTVVNFHLFNPVTNEGFSNVTVKIIEQKDITKPFQLTNEYETIVIWEGKTDSNGKASYSFKGRKNGKYTYWTSVDESFMVGKEIITQPEYKPLTMLSTNDLTYKVVVDNINVVIWWKNTNCFDTNDKCRFRERDILKSEVWSDWKPSITSFFPNGYIEGCYEYHSSSVGQLPQNITEVEYEVTRNGITTTFKDTLYLIGNSSIDTLKYFY